MTTEEISRNVYADIGVTNPEQMLRKARIVEQINQVIRCSAGRFSSVAGILGLSETELKELLHGHFHDYREADLVEYLEKLYQDKSFAGAKLGE